MLNPRLGFLGRIFNGNLKQRAAQLEAENTQLHARVRYEQARADLADRTEEVEELKRQVKQLRAVLDTCAQVLASAAKS
jgi:hypothetical protein